MKMTFALFLIFTVATMAQAQKPDAKEWGIADYLKNLPEKYITTSGDFSPRSAETAVVDEKNGYAAYLNSPPQRETDSSNAPYPIFEMALFKSQGKPPLLVVSNTKSDPVCTDYETFFLRRVGNKWLEVRREVLPPLDLKMFWDKPQSAARFLKIVERDNSTSFHFEPPRTGTRMKVSLEICDHFLEVAPMKSVDELKKLVESARPIYLTWDKQTGKFNFAK
jgi:hypothetical protein